MTDPASPSATPTLVLEAGRTEAHYWRDLWRYRELFLFLTWRDLLVRYKQTAVGVAWALIQPAMTTAVFCVFGHILKLPTGGVPRAVLIFAAQLPWSFFSSSLSSSSSSLVNNTQLISKVYFPRLIIPFSAVVVSLVDFFISAAFLAALMAYYGLVPDGRLLALPLFLLVAFGAALGAGLWLTALNVKYRDFRFVLPFIIQFGLYVSPIAFTSDLVPARWRTVYELNPMVGIIDGFRWALLRGNAPSPWTSLAYSCALVTVLLVTGVWYFRKTEKTFADVI
ncbi:MAG TPA: ABC transporter permease [Opitutaceae bacterium]|jgi:lipopolysaccharide transport system permease protein|nr:ABC transporter permease [Opitutaceae bacterium]